MTRIASLLLVAVFLMAAGAGCRTKESGSREFIPGKGWTPTK